MTIQDLLELQDQTVEALHQRVGDLETVGDLQTVGDFHQTVGDHPPHPVVASFQRRQRVQLALGSTL